MQLNQYFENKVLLITGGTGTFGNAVLEIFLKTNIKEIRIFSRDEKKQDEMRHKYQDKRLKFYIGNVQDYATLKVATKSTHYIFHAAALKQVPSCEFFPMEAVKTNIIGTQNLIRAAKENDIQKIICLSTDKAAYPINSMGMSKGLMEKIVFSEARNDYYSSTVVCCTRYGNIIGSRGSVIPLFFKQIKQNKAITVTDPKMTRFMMNIEEAISLVLYAFINGKSGDLFVQKSPASTVIDIANAVKAIANSSNKIKIIGSRHGEKLYETLLTREEMLHSQDLGDYYRVPLDSRDLSYHLYEDNGLIEKIISDSVEYNSNNTQRLSLDATIKKIKSANLQEEVN